jgi:hypothetical protein
MFEDPLLMQQLGLAPYMEQPVETQTDQHKPPPTQGWSMGLILTGILLMLVWVAVPLGGLGAWFYGPIEGVFTVPTYTRWEMMILASVFTTVGFVGLGLIQASIPRVNWVENDPGMPRVTYLRDIEDLGGHYILTRRDRKKIRVAKDICSRYRKQVHVTAHVLEIDARPGSEHDIEFRTTAGSMSRGQIQAEEDLGMRQQFREQQLEEISQQYVAGQMDQIDGVG